MKIYVVGIIFIFCCGVLFSQSDPGDDTQVDLLTTYGNMAVKNSSEEDSRKTIFFVLPESFESSFYVRVFDPDCGGAHDDSNGLWETNTEFEVYGGVGCVKLPAAGSENNDIGHGAGTLLQEKLFADEPRVDGTWVTFGPFTAEQGEKLKEYSARFFTLCVGGTTGNDKNQYAVFLSNSDHQNEEVEGAAMYKNAYAFNEDLKGGKYNYSLEAQPIE